jgi:hypothetical protein
MADDAMQVANKAPKTAAGSLRNGRICDDPSTAMIPSIIGCNESPRPGVNKNAKNAEDMEPFDAAGAARNRLSQYR